MKRYRTKNFTFEELEYSETSNKLNINNTIPKELECNAKRLLDFLQDIREKWGSAIRINSGYRCEVLNKTIKGSKTSAHLYCNAVDIYPVNNKFDEFKEFIIKYLEDKNFDQAIIERSISKSGKIDSEWVHIGLFNNSGKQRRQIFSLDV